MEMPRTDKLVAGVSLIGRTGASQFQLRYSDDEIPTVWIAVAGYKGGYEAAASIDPERAVLRLCEAIVDGGLCTHCRRPTGFDPDSINRMPLDDLLCWYQWDPGSKKFIRGCA